MFEAFTPPTPDSGPVSPVREHLQGLYSARMDNGEAHFTHLTAMPRKRLRLGVALMLFLHLELGAPRQPSDSPSEGLSSPPAGMASPRFAWAADMVPQLAVKHSCTVLVQARCFFLFWDLFEYFHNFDAGCFRGA